MATKKSGLGKGLGSLIEDAALESGNNKTEEELPLSEIKPNPNQPRTNFNEEAISDLAESIKKEGLLQPILVRPDSKGYQIIAGERRWHACRQAGLKKVPVRIMPMDDVQTLRVALIENLQRTDLNAIEEARGYKDLMKVGNLTQEQLSKEISKSRSSIANSLRLLDLPEEVQALLYEGKITAGHARAVLAIPEEEKRIKLAQKIADEKLSVREAENLARLYASAGDIERAKKPPVPRSYKIIAKDLRKRLGTAVKVKTGKGKNKIEIDFQDEEDLQRIFMIIKHNE